MTPASENFISPEGFNTSCVDFINLRQPNFGVCGRVEGEKAFRNDFRPDEFIVFGDVLGERTNSVADRITAARIADGCDDSRFS